MNADVPEISVSGGSMLSKNLFAYCENCPTIADDQDGLWLNVVIGAVVGGAISGISTKLTGGEVPEIVTSVITGAISGAFAATGVGGILGQAAVSAVLSGVDTAVGTYQEYKKGKVNLSGAVAKTVTSATLGAAFGAMGAEGTGAFKQSCSIVKNTRSALKTICSRNTLKASKKIAKKTISNTVKYAIKTAKGEFISGGVSSVVSWGASWYAGRYYTWATGGNRYETA